MVYQAISQGIFASVAVYSERVDANRHGCGGGSGPLQLQVRRFNRPVRSPGPRSNPRFFWPGPTLRTNTATRQAATQMTVKLTANNGADQIPQNSGEAEPRSLKRRIVLLSAIRRRAA